MKKSLSLLFIVTIVLQSCYVYQKTSVPITKATNNGRVKIIRESGNEFQVKEIILDDGYYANYQGSLVLIDTLIERQYYPLDKNKTRSKTALSITTTIVVPFGLLIGIGFIVLAVNGM